MLLRVSLVAIWLIVSNLSYSLPHAGVTPKTSMSGTAFYLNALSHDGNMLDRTLLRDTWGFQLSSSALSLEENVYPNLAAANVAAVPLPESIWLMGYALWAFFVFKKMRRNMR